MTDDDEKRDGLSSNNKRRISSETLALLIVDALIDANIVNQEHFEKAKKIATEEIDVRKACGDY